MPASEIAGCAALNELELWGDMLRQTPGGVVLDDDGLLLLICAGARASSALIVL
jgi:hypothetical protein